MFTLDWSGSANIKQALQEFAQFYPKATLEAMREEAEIEMTEAKQRTPVKTGNLRASGIVLGPDEDGTVTLQFGGPAAPYAVYVHENLDAFHKVGQAKFLESVVLESAPNMAERLAERIVAIISGRSGGPDVA